MSNKATFKTKLLQAGKTATGFKIPAKVVESFGVGKKPPVRVTIKGYTYRNTVAVYGGEFMIGVSAEHRAGAGVKADDLLEVTLELDTEPRVIDVPGDFQKALNKNAMAREKFESLSFSNKNGFVLQIKGAKTEETRQRRIEKAILQLSTK